MNPQRRSLLFGSLAAAVAATTGALAVAAAPKVVKVVARRFTYTPNRIALAKDVPVVFELTSLDVLMGFSLPDFGVRADVIPGKTTRLPFTPDKAGTFTFLCDIFCGSGHETMNGTLVVA